MLATILAAVALAAPAQPVRPVSTNPYFPFHPGMRWVYRGSSEDGPVREVVRIKRGSAIVGGYRVAIFRDLGFVRGRLEEATTDWYGQDAAGTVWYFGEATTTY